MPIRSKQGGRHVCENAIAHGVYALGHRHDRNEVRRVGGVRRSIGVAGELGIAMVGNDQKVPSFSARLP